MEKVLAMADELFAVSEEAVKVSLCWKKSTAHQFRV